MISNKRYISKHLFACRVRARTYSEILSLAEKRRNSVFVWTTFDKSRTCDTWPVFSLVLTLALNKKFFFQFSKFNQFKRKILFVSSRRLKTWFFFYKNFKSISVVCKSKTLFNTLNSCARRWPISFTEKNFLKSSRVKEIKKIGTLSHIQLTVYRRKKKKKRIKWTNLLWEEITTRKPNNIFFLFRE